MIGQLLAGHYRVLQVLGVGGFGQTYITEDLHLPGNPKCVLKHLKPASADRSLLDIARKFFEKEAIVLQQLGNHDRIPRLLAYFEEQQEFYLVQEYIAGHPLSSELKSGHKWSEPQVIELLQEILDILVFIHSQGVIHRDIKPDNIMRRASDRRLILIDFGAIKQVRNQQMLHGQQTMTVAIGTPGYMPIEQASGNPRASSDLYALGTIGIQALTGVNPYELPSDDRTGELKWEHLTVANPQLIAILQRMTRYHFKDRYLTATEALHAVRGLLGSNFTPDSTYVQTVQPVTQPKRHSIDSQATVVAPRSGYTTPPVSPSTLPRQPTRSFFPLAAGMVSIVAAVGSFAWFSGRLLNQRNFDTDLQSDLCRIATPTDLPATRVRSQPQRDAKIQANLPRGTKVVYLEEKDAFIQIQMVDRSTGWVYNNQITGCNVPLATPKPKPIPTQSIESPKPIPVAPPRVNRKPIASPVVPEPIPSDTPTPSPSPTPTPSPSPSPIEIEVPSPSPSVTPTPSIYPGRSRPTPSPSIPIPSPSPSAEQSPAVIDQNLNKSGVNKLPEDKITSQIDSLEKETGFLEKKIQEKVREVDSHLVPDAESLAK
ncbi:serine/threonine protein kinase [Chamaesiphon sp. VAR_48_metabat_135_sub]|uniref:serine/threonine protein kinase n=1 Tax=Chamaesiphon sp. VAR_48_metabat_135_sub TaxID=2964699 RepID=UPI00286AA994|nr:serine/threonine protein kinase [Chamaesiphon sp. VAR_48_metabat_135_sub]